MIQLSASEREDDNETTEMENLSVCQQKDLKKKKKNKKRRKIGPKPKMSSDLDQENDEIEDEITRTVRLVDKMFGTSHQYHHQQRSENSQQAEADNVLSILSIQSKNLNPQTEIKRMFGKVINQEQQKKRRGAGNVRSLRTVILTTPKDNWPPITRSGLSMNLVPAPEGEITLAGNDKRKNLLYFAFEHSQR